MYNYYLRAVAGRLRQAFATQQDRAWSTFLSLMKLTFLDMGLAIDTYINSRERTIREQQAAIQELPTPVLPFREGMLLVPIIGLIRLATRAAANRTATGCSSGQSGKGGSDRYNGRSSSRFEGRKSYGANGRGGSAYGCDRDRRRRSPEIAQTMVTLGIDLGRMITVGDLQSGIEKAEELLGYTVTRIRAKTPVAIIGRRECALQYSSRIKT